MVQTIKAYKFSWKQNLKAYKSNMGTNYTKHSKEKEFQIYKYKPKYHSQTDPWVLEDTRKL